MSKVLVCFSSHIFFNGQFKLISYYEGLINELVNAGNDVLSINCAEFLTKSWNSNNKESSFIKVDKFRDEVAKFNPDLVIAFNNAKPSFIEDIVSCPIAIWEADSFNFYNDKEIILKDPNQYHYFCLSRDAKEKILSIGANNSNVHMINSGTSIKSHDIDKKYNISFIGSNFKGCKGLKPLLTKHNSPDVKSTVSYLSKNFYINPKEYLEKEDKLFILDYIKPEEFGMISSAQSRIATLNILSELGLTLFGTKSWLDTYETCPDLAMAYEPMKIYSLKHNQDVYNSSNISLNVSHAQAVDGFSWRIMDIMASNSVLLSSYNKGIERFTKGFVDIPMYRSSGEAYDLARKLLKDDIYRKDIIEASNACIESKGRWAHRFEEIYEATGVKLRNDKIGSLSLLTRDDYIVNYYQLYSNFISKLALLMPKSSRKLLYNLATKLGFSIDYQMVKSVMDKSEDV